MEGGPETNSNSALVVWKAVLIRTLTLLVREIVFFFRFYVVLIFLTSIELRQLTKQISMLRPPFQQVCTSFEDRGLLVHPEFIHTLLNGTRGPILNMQVNKLTFAVNF